MAIHNKRIAIFIILWLIVPVRVFAQSEEDIVVPVKVPNEELASITKAKNQLDQNKKIIDEQQKKLIDLGHKIDELTSKKNEAGNQAEIASKQLELVEIQVNQTELQLQQTILSANEAQEGIKQVQQELESLIQDIEVGRQQMSQFLRLLYEQENLSFLEVILGRLSLGQYMAEQNTYQELQNRALSLTKELRDRQIKRQEYQFTLQEKQVGLQKLQEVQVYQLDDLNEKQQTKKIIAKQKKDDQLLFGNQLKEAKQARLEIEKNIFSLKGVDINLSLEDAFSAANFASSVTGIRPSLLLAMVKIETNVGQNVGSGEFPNDMHPQSREAFLRITQKLNLDPNTAPISRRPRSYQGWGGAMGPGQFMPATWETIEGRVAGLMGKSLANPYELAEALVGTGIMLSDRGATSEDKEFEAISRYLAGPNWMYHSWYANRVLAVAAEYEKEGIL